MCLCDSVCVCLCVCVFQSVSVSVSVYLPLSRVDRLAQWSVLAPIQAVLFLYFPVKCLSLTVLHNKDKDP